MRKRIGLSMAAGLMAAVMTMPGAGAAETIEVPDYWSFPDVNNELAVFVNQSRANYCTADVVAFEEAILVWFESGMAGPPPDEPDFPPGLELVTLHFNINDKGALVGQINEHGLYLEVWRLDSPENRPFIGPCTDTDDDATMLGTGTTSYKAHDNDFFGSGTRGNTFGDQGEGNISGSEGSFSYKWKFHFNNRCYAPMDGPPVCLLDRGTLKAK